jgi:dTDP-4-dehydrorhamnose reductase
MTAEHDASRARVLVLGAGGMLGHKLMLRLARDFNVMGTLRGNGEPYRSSEALAVACIRCGVDASDLSTIAQALDESRPVAAINCIGVIKQREGANDPAEAIAVNALFPHLLARLCAERFIRLIHFSTDCVFSGKGGPYRETDFADAADLYGRTKLLGEVAQSGCLTLRTSIIGRELAHHASLIEWFLSQHGRRIKGFANALYSGFTTNAMADVVATLLSDFPALCGLWHVASDPISKFELLGIVNEIYGAGVDIARDETFVCDRRLDGSRFRAETGIAPPPWRKMIENMRSDPTVYRLAQASRG